MTIAASVARRIKAFHRPYNVEAPEPLPRVQWTPRRKVALGIMLICGGYYLWKVTYASTTWLMYVLSPRSEVARIPAVPGNDVLWSLMQWAEVVGLALIVLTCMWTIAGKEATGLSRPARIHATGLGYYLRTVIPYSVMAGFVYQQLVRLMPSANNASARHDSVDTAAPSAVLEAVVGAVSTAISEEVIATVLVYWLLDLMCGPKGKTLAASGWGTAIIIAVHVMYHTYYGVAVVMMIPSVYFTVVCWRHTRSLLAIVVGHAMWDLMLIASSQTVLKILLIAGILLGVKLDHKPKKEQAPQLA